MRKEAAEAWQRQLLQQATGGKPAGSPLYAAQPVPLQRQGPRGSAGGAGALQAQGQALELQMPVHQQAGEDRATPESDNPWAIVSAEGVV